MFPIYDEQRKIIAEQAKLQTEALANEMKMRLERVTKDATENLARIASETELYMKLGFYARYNRSYVVPGAAYVWGSSIGNCKYTSTYLRRLARQMGRYYIEVRFHEQTTDIELPNLKRLAPIYSALELMAGTNNISKNDTWKTLRIYSLRTLGSSTMGGMAPLHPFVVQFIDSMQNDPVWKEACMIRNHRR